MGSLHPAFSTPQWHLCFCMSALRRTRRLQLSFSAAPHTGHKTNPPCGSMPPFSFNWQPTSVRVIETGETNSHVPPLCNEGAPGALAPRANSSRSPPRYYSLVCDPDGRSVVECGATLNNQSRRVTRRLDGPDIRQNGQPMCRIYLPEPICSATLFV